MSNKHVKTEDAEIGSDSVLPEGGVDAIVEPVPDSAVHEIRAKVAAKAAAPSTKQKSVKEPVLSPDLLPYKEQMSKWVSAHADFLEYFFNIQGHKFEIVYGDWFYYSPEKDEICLGVKAFKEAVEKHKEEVDSGAMSMDQIFFALLHEISHFKTALENDKAGKQNLLNQFKYMAAKKIESADVPGEFVGLGGTYAEFYNILEDAIVNYMVANTIHFRTPRAKKEILDLYTEKFFQLFAKAAEGEGDYAMLPDSKTGIPRPQKTEKGAGDLRLLKADDYEKGFDAAELVGMESLTSQFLTFFIKTQMGVMDVKEFYDGTEWRNGKYKVPAPVAAVFREPLHKLYKRLITAVLQKYTSEPDKLKRYTDFMIDTTSVPVYSKGAKGISITGSDVVSNVFPPHVLKARKIVAEAWGNFLFLLKETGIKDASQMTLIEIFNKFKELDLEKYGKLEIPFARSYTQRTAIMRRIIEPVFSLFCILDDSFDIKLPPASQQHGGEPQEGGEGEDGEPQEGEDGEPQEGEDGEPQEEDLNTPWKEGVEVEDRRTRKRGVIKKRYQDVDGNVTSVDVAWFEDVKTAMATTINGRDVEFTGEESNVVDPVKNLIVIRKNQPSKEKGKRQKPGKIKYKNLDDESQKEEKGEESGESDKEDENENGDEPGEGDKSNEPGEGGGSKEKSPASMDDVKKIFGGLIDALEESIKEDERKENAEAFKKASQTADYRDKQNQIQRNKDLEEALRKLREKGKSPDPNPENDSRQTSFDKELINIYNELAKKIAPYTENMAQNWREVVESIAQVVSIEKDKYYTRGKIDIKRAQRYLPEVEYGVDLDEKRIKQLWVERIRTELRPKMLRLHLVVDNSGSMDGKIEQIRMAIMLLNGSLRSLRSQFKDELRSVLGDSYSPDMDLVCDVQITTFGSQSRLVKPFAIQDFSFLHADAREISILPSPDMDEEQVATIAAFGEIDCSEGTDDTDFWPALIDSYTRKPELMKALKEGKLTDVILQISDGAITGTEIAVAALKRLWEIGVKHGGFAIGGEGAKDSLAERHGAEKVTSADSAEEIVDKFSEFLKATIKDEVQKPVIASISGGKEEENSL
jgi:hypothetical protein